MIARIFTLLTFSLIFGALYTTYQHRTPSQPEPLKQSGVIASYIYTPKEILSLDIHDGAIVYLYQEEGAPTIRVEADTSLLPFIDLQCQNATVTLHHRKSEIIPKDMTLPLYYIVVPDIASLTVHGNAQIIVPLTIKVDSLDINIRGNSQITAAIDTKELDVQSHGNSTLRLSGSALEQYIELHGSSRYEAQDLTSDECSIQASGATIALLHATKVLQGTLSGSSNITFCGNPEIFVTKNDRSQLKKHASSSQSPENHE